MSDADALLEESSVKRIAAAVAARQVTPTEIARAALRRIDRLDPQVRAFSFLDREAVLAEARRLTADVDSGALRGPLHGVPFGMKEQFFLKGAPTLINVMDPSPPIADFDAAVVTRLRDAGALAMGKLYMDGGATPPTRNPWNLAATPGASSAGSGAAVAARLVPFALAEQTVGSTLRPAAFCGVSALKPTYGRVSCHGLDPVIYSFDHPAVIATSPEDLSLVFSVIEGYDARDPRSRHPQIPRRQSRDAPRIGVLNLDGDVWSPAMTAALRSAAERLEDAGASVVRYELPADFELLHAVDSIIGSSEREVVLMRSTLPRRPSRLSQNYRRRFHRFTSEVTGMIPATYYIQAQRLRHRIAASVDRSMMGFDAVLTASTPEAAPTTQEMSGDPSLIAPWSTLGLPAVGIPAGLDEQGMPLGFQLLGPRDTDEDLLATSGWCLDVLGGLPTPPMEWQ